MTVHPDALHSWLPSDDRRARPAGLRANCVAVLSALAPTSLALFSPGYSVPIVSAPPPSCTRFSSTLFLASDHRSRIQAA